MSSGGAKTSKKGGAAAQGKGGAGAKSASGTRSTADRLAIPSMAAVPTMINIGYGNLIVAARVVSIVSPQSSPMRRLREQASKSGKLIDATEGRRTRSILVTDSDHIILSAINPETIASRLMPDGHVGGGS